LAIDVFNVEAGLLTIETGCGCAGAGVGFIPGVGERSEIEGEEEGASSRPANGSAGG
jgi:hypothetical protein